MNRLEDLSLLGMKLLIFVIELAAYFGVSFWGPNLITPRVIVDPGCYLMGNLISRQGLNRSE